MDRKLFVVGAVATSTIATIGVVDGKTPSPATGVLPLPSAPPPSENTVTVSRAAAVDKTTGRVIVPGHRRSHAISSAPVSTGAIDHNGAGGVLTDIAFEYDFPGYDRIFIQNTGAADAAPNPGLGDAPARGFLRYTTSGSYVEFYESRGGTSARGKLLDFYEPPDSLGRTGKLLKRIDILAERGDFEARTHYAYDDKPLAQRALAYGKVFYAIGDDAAAIHQLGAVFTSSSDYWNGDARMLLAAAYEDMDDAAAATIFKGAPPDERHQRALARARGILDFVARHPNHFTSETVNTARVGLARIARASGDLDEALKQYDLVLADPTLAFHRRQLVSTGRHAYARRGSSQGRQARHDSEFGRGAAQRAKDHRKRQNVNVAIPNSALMKSFAASRSRLPGASALPAAVAAKVQQMHASAAARWDVIWQTMATSVDPLAMIPWIPGPPEIVKQARLLPGASPSDARSFCKAPYFWDIRSHEGRTPSWSSTETQISEAHTDSGTASVTLHFAEIDRQLLYAFSVLYKPPYTRAFNGDLKRATIPLQQAVQTFQDEIAVILGRSAS